MLELQNENMVLAGNFNPYLLSPEWLAREEIWAVDEVQLSLGAVPQDGVNFRGDDTQWFVSAYRLGITSTFAGKCSELAASVLHKLPHTPISAVGCTFTYQEAETENNDPIFALVSERARAAGTEPQLSRWGILLHEDSTRIDVSFVSGTHGLTGVAHFHRSVSDFSAAIEAITAHPDDSKKATELVTGLLKERQT